MTEGQADRPLPAPRARWKRRFAIALAIVAVLLVVSGAGAVLAWHYRTDVLAWAIAAYLEGDNIQTVSMNVVAVERDHLLIRDLRITGKRETTVATLDATYSFSDVIAGSVRSLTLTKLRSSIGALPLEIAMVKGDGRFNIRPFEARHIQAGLDLIRLRLGEENFDPSRVEIDYRNGMLVLDTAFTAPHGYLTVLGSGPLDDSGTPFRLLLSGRVNAAVAAAPLADTVDANGHLAFSLSAQVTDPLFFLDAEEDAKPPLPESLTLDGEATLAFDHLRILETVIPTAAPDRVRFKLDAKIDDHRTADGTFDFGVDLARRDTPEFGFEKAETTASGRFALNGSTLALTLADGPLLKLREMRLSKGLPVPGDIALQILGGGNSLTVDLADGTVRHALESQLSWKAGELSVSSQGDLSDAADPTVFTIRGTFDATPLLALYPATKSASGNANLFLAGRISQPLLLYRSPPAAGGQWPGTMRLDGAAKLETKGLRIPGADADPDADDSIEIMVKGFNGSDSQQAGRLVINGVLSPRKFGGTFIDRSKLALEGKLSFGTRGYRFVPGIDSVLNIQSLKTDSGIAVPNGLNFQLTGDENHITVPADLSAVFHELTFAHLEANGYLTVGGDKQKPFLVTVPKITSRRIEDGKLRVYLTGGSFDLAEDKWDGRGINASLEQTAEGYDLGFETGEIRNEARPPLTTPFTVSGKGKIAGELLRATLTADQRYSPLKLLATVKHDLSTQAGRAEFRVPKTRFGSKKTALDDIFPPASGWFKTADGAAAATGHLLWDKDLLSGEMSVVLDKINLATEDMRLGDISGTLNFIELLPLSMPPRQRLTGTIATGQLGPWPMVLEFQLREDGKVDVQDLDIGMAGGVVRTRALVDPLAGGTAKGSVQVRSIDLHELLELIGVDGLNGTGRITGTVPIQFSDGSLAVSDGSLGAEGPGILRYSGTALHEQLAARPDTVGTVAQVLSDFHYKTLSMELNKSADGMGVIMLHLNGANPKVLEGHPFAFNIRIESDFHKLGRIATGGLKAVGDAIQQLNRPKSTNQE